MHDSQNSLGREQAVALTLESYKVFPGREMCAPEPQLWVLVGAMGLWNA